MYFIVALAANDDEILRNILPAVLVVLQVVKFEDSRVLRGPTVDAPPADATGVVVACVYGPLHILLDASVVRFRDAVFRLKDALSYSRDRDGL